MSRRAWISAAAVSGLALAGSVLFTLRYGTESADHAAGIASFVVGVVSLALTLVAIASAVRARNSSRAMDTIRLSSERDRTPYKTVVESQEEWLQTRRRLNSNRARLARAAARLYPPSVRVGETGLIAPPVWSLPEPVDLASLALRYTEECPPPKVTGRENEARSVLPKSADREWFSRYSDALRHIERPTGMDNRFSWRMLDVSLSKPNRASFGPMFYFDAIDACEAVAHETASIMRIDGGDELTIVDFPLRRLINDPFDLTRRAVLPAVSTLLIRNQGRYPTCVLHFRDAKKVAVAGGTFQVIPSGAFQPSSQHRSSEQQDFSIWRNVMREYSEEILGDVSQDGNDLPCDYTSYPFDILDAGRESGRLRIYLLGFALDALTLWGEILTVAVVAPELFDSLNPQLAEPGEYELRNDREGNFAKVIPFRRSAVRDITRQGALAPAGAGCLDLALRHRSTLLAT